MQALTILSIVLGLVGIVVTVVLSLFSDRIKSQVGQVEWGRISRVLKRMVIGCFVGAVIFGGGAALGSYGSFGFLVDDNPPQPPGPARPSASRAPTPVLTAVQTPLTTSPPTPTPRPDFNNKEVAMIGDEYGNPPNNILWCLEANTGLELSYQDKEGIVSVAESLLARGRVRCGSEIRMCLKDEPSKCEDLVIVTKFSDDPGNPDRLFLVPRIVARKFGFEDSVTRVNVYILCKEGKPC